MRHSYAKICASRWYASVGFDQRQQTNKILCSWPVACITPAEVLHYPGACFERNYWTTLAAGEIPDELKTAMLLPLLKKANPNSEDLANYRSVSNLTFVSKLILKAVFNKLNGYNLTDNDLHVTFQSAYKVFHSTETSLLKVHNDIVLALDKGRTCWWFCLQQKSNTKTYGDRAFSTCAPRLWNNIPLDILRSNSVSTF